VFLRRCAWHRKYHGHVKLLGVSSWQGWGVTFSDGMCSDCAARARAEWRLPAASSRPARPIRRSLRPDLAFAAVVLLAAVGVTFGIVVGPPGSRTVSETSAPAPSAVATREAGQPTPPAAVPTPPPPSPRVLARAPAVRPLSPVAEQPGEPDRAVLARPAPPVRLTRVAARRTVTASYRPLTVAQPVEIVSAPEAAIEAPPPPVRWLAAVPTRVEVQAP